MATFFPNLFGTPRQQPAQPQPAQPGGPQPAPAPGPAPAFSMLNNQPGNTPPAPPAPAPAPVSPLDSFSSMWQTGTNPDGTPKEPPKDPWSEPLLNADPAKIMESATKYDFMRSVPPELVQKATGGDFQALMQIMNHVGQQALGIGAQLSSASIEHSGSRIRERFDSSFGERFKQHSLQQMPTANPALKHPAAAPMLKMIREQAQQANPQWTPKEVADYAESYFTQLAAAFNPQQSNQSAPGSSSGEQDWMSWIDQGKTS